MQGHYKTSFLARNPHGAACPIGEVGRGQKTFLGTPHAIPWRRRAYPPPTPLVLCQSIFQIFFAINFPKPNQVLSYIAMHNHDKYKTALCTAVLSALLAQSVMAQYYQTPFTQYMLMRQAASDEIW